MRILHISTRLILGGSQENTVLSCEGQARRGHEVHLAFGPIYGPEGSLLDRIDAFNKRCRSGEEHTVDDRVCHPITTHTVPNLLREISLGKDRRCLHELRDLITSVQPDIVHTHSSKAGILGRIAAWTATHKGPYEPASERPAQGSDRRPGIVHTIHGPPFMPLEGGPLSRLKIASLNYAYTLAERRAAAHCHLIVSVADAMTQEFLRRRIGRADQYVTVRSGMEIEPYLHAAPGESRAEMRAELGLNPDDFVIGTVARLAQHKGHDDLLDALGDTLRKNPRWKLLWVGDGWWRERLLQRAKSMELGVRELPESLTQTAPASSRASASASISPSIILTGLVPPERIPSLIRALDVLAHPSYREGLPRTVPQALLSGVCPVAYDVDGTREACQEMVTGRLVPLADRATLREAITWCAENPAERLNVASRGRELCIREFSAEVMVEGLERAYARAMTLAGHRAGPRSG